MILMCKDKNETKMSAKLFIIISIAQLTGDLVCVIIGLGIEKDNGSHGKIHGASVHIDRYVQTVQTINK